MPQYHFDRNLAQETWKALDAFTQGYIECAFWTGDDESGIPDLGLHDLASEALAQMKADCAAFQEMAAADLEAANEFASLNYDTARAGHDFWLTRNGHGAGFWDRGFGDLRTDTIGGRLSRDAKTFGECDLYLGDDGKVYVS